MKRLNRLIAMAAAVGLATMIAPSWSSAAVGQATRLRLIDLGTLGGPSSQANAINEMGYVVGSSTTDGAGTTHAFLWRGRRMIDLGTLGGDFSQASAINNRGEIVGSSTTADGDSHAFLWRDGRMTDLGTLDGQFSSVARAINDRSEIVGDGYGPQGYQAFLWRDGQMSALPMPQGAQDSSATDINNRGEIVGSTFGATTAVRWRDGHPMLMGDNEFITAINDRGQMTCGRWFLYNSAWLRTSRARTPIDMPAGSTYIEASGLNNRGAVVGYVGGLGAFVWEHGRMSFLPSPVGQPTSATDINDRGQITGAMVIVPPGVIYTHAVLWTRE